MITLDLNDRVSAQVVVYGRRHKPDPSVGYRGEYELLDVQVNSLTTYDVTLSRAWLLARGYAESLDALVFDRLIDSDLLREGTL